MTQQPSQELAAVGWAGALLFLLVQAATHVPHCAATATALDLDVGVDGLAAVQHRARWDALAAGANVCDVKNSGCVRASFLTAIILFDGSHFLTHHCATGQTHHLHRLNMCITTTSATPART
jgi:hypothetical protein